MPGSRGWQDYIPASGEASVSLGLKGRYGKGAKRMYRRRSFRGKRNGRAIWVVDDQALMPPGPTQLSNTGTNLVCGINPNLSQPVATSQTLNFEQKAKLIGIQGRIPVWRDFSDATAITSQVDTGVGQNLQLLFYIWRVAELTADALSPSNTGNNEPMPFTGGDLQVMLQADNVLNWGFIELPPPELANLGSVTGLQTVMGSLNVLHKLRYIPRPRIPRMGITLGRTKSLCLWTRRMMWDTTAQDWVNPLNGHPAFAQPMLRARYIK